MAGLEKELLEAQLPTKSGFTIISAKPCLTPIWDIGCCYLPPSKLSATGGPKQFIFSYLKALATFSGRVKPVSHTL